MNNNLDKFQIVDIVFTFVDTYPEIIYTYFNPVKLLEKKETYTTSSIRIEDEHSHTFYSDSMCNTAQSVINRTVNLEGMVLVKTEINKLG